MELVVDNFAQVRESNGWDALKESGPLLAEVLDKVTGHKDEGCKQVSGTCVSSLRKQLAARGLDPDGTKEMLVERLKGADLLKKLGSF